MAEKQLQAEALRTSGRFTTRIIQSTAIGFDHAALPVITRLAPTDFERVTACSPSSCPERPPPAGSDLRELGEHRIKLPQLRDILAALVHR
jgi:hypothetical protein